MFLPLVNPPRMPPQTKIIDGAVWAIQAAELIQGAINAVLLEQGECGVMLTGGHSAARLYSAWAASSAFQQLTGVRFYFGDDRCVPPDHPESNYGMALRTLFLTGIPAGCSVLPMQADDPDRETAARRYGEALPDSVDVMLLGVGEDGHIASLFPASAALRETRWRVVSVNGPKLPYERLTITPPVIARAKSIFVLASGPIKAAVLSKALQAPDDFDSLPARLALNATWLLDTPLREDSH